MHRRSATEKAHFTRRPSAARSILAARSRQVLRLFALLALAAGPTMAGEAAAAEVNGLRASHTLSSPQASDETERALLRLEARVGKVLNEDRAVIGDLLDRVGRMTAVVAEIRKLVTDMPTGQSCKPAPASCPAPAEPLPLPSSGSKSEFAGLDDAGWLTIAGGAVLLGLTAAWFLRRRSRPEAKVALGAAGHDGAAPLTIPPPNGKGTDNGKGKPATAKPASRAAELPRPAPPAPPAALQPVPQPSAPTVPLASDTGITVKEGMDSDMSLELAEVMLSMGLADGAAHTLADQIRKDPRHALSHWLKLLEVHRQSGNKAEFDKAVGELQKHFNIAPPGWMETSENTGAKVERLEDFPHIVSRIQELWPHRTCDEYLNRLLEDTRGGTRMGFPQPVVEEILLLRAILKS